MPVGCKRQPTGRESEKSEVISLSHDTTQRREKVMEITDETRPCKENDWIISLRNQMESDLAEGKRKYLQIAYRRVNHTENEEYLRTLFLEKCYPNYARFSVPALFGQVSECFTYYDIHTTMRAAG